MTDPRNSETPQGPDPDPDEAEPEVQRPEPAPEETEPEVEGAEREPEPRGPEREPPESGAPSGADSRRTGMKAEPRPPPARGGRRGRATRPVDPERPCMNCGDPTPGQYCPTCGQRKVDVQVSVRTLVMDVLEDQLILDKRLPRTLGALLFKPGHMTVEHVNGRIVRYIHPFRLYLVTSLIFFLLLSFVSLRVVRQALDEETGVADAVDVQSTAAIGQTLSELRALADTITGDEAREEIQARIDALAAQRQSLRLDSLERVVTRLDAALARIDAAVGDTAVPGSVRGALRANRSAIERQREAALSRRSELLADTTGATPSSGEDRTLRVMFGWDEDPPEVSVPGPPAVDSALAGQLRRLGAMTPREAGETVLGTFFNYVPTMMFILLPVFAGILKLLYIRRRRYYAEHFVFLLHVHSFVFILAAVMLLLPDAWLAGVPEVALLLWILVYIYVAMKRVYGQGWLKTFAKYWILGWMYFWILGISVPIAFVAALLLF